MHDIGRVLFAVTFGGAGDDWATAVAVAADAPLSSNYLYVVGDHNSDPYYFGDAVLRVSYGQYDLRMSTPAPPPLPRRLRACVVLCCARPLTACRAHLFCTPTAQMWHV
jgi:hypothetical protein